MSKKTKTVQFGFNTSSLLCGVSDMYNDLLKGGYDSEEALHHIMGDAILNYHLEKKYPNWLPSGVTEVAAGNYEVQLQKI
jgi:hypothetical protein